MRCTVDPVSLGAGDTSGYYDNGDDRIVIAYNTTTAKACEFGRALNNVLITRIDSRR